MSTNFESLAEPGHLRTLTKALCQQFKKANSTDPDLTVPFRKQFDQGVNCLLRQACQSICLSINQ